MSFFALLRDFFLCLAGSFNNFANNASDLQLYILSAILFLVLFLSLLEVFFILVGFFKFIYIRCSKRRRSKK